MKGGGKSNKTIEEAKPTHKGWLGICPVLITNPHLDGPEIVERHRAFAPLLSLVVRYYLAKFALVGYLFPGLTQSWPLRITGKV